MEWIKNIFSEGSSKNHLVADVLLKKKPIYSIYSTKCDVSWFIMFFFKYPDLVASICNCTWLLSRCCFLPIKLEKIMGSEKTSAILEIHAVAGRSTVLFLFALIRFLLSYIWIYIIYIWICIYSFLMIFLDIDVYYIYIYIYISYIYIHIYIYIYILCISFFWTFFPRFLAAQLFCPWL